MSPPNEFFGKRDAQEAAEDVGIVRDEFPQPAEIRGHFVCFFDRVPRADRQPFYVAEVFTGTPGVLVDLPDTIRGFKGLCEGDYDHLPEQSFYMVGTIEEAVKKAERLAAEVA